MTRARGRALAAAIALLVALAVAVALLARKPASQPAGPGGARPTLLLLTSLPLVFSEEFSLEGGSAALDALETRYRVVPISVTDEAGLSNGRLLLMAHPRAQPPENLVALDQWIRDGGRVLLLADPMLEWASTRPLGDPLRAPPMFADTGLLARWGLRLDAPDERGPESRRLGRFDLLTASPGRLSGTCEIVADGLVARCRVGRGRATVVADADLLNVDSGDRQGTQNLEAILSELALLARWP
ncbi:MAG TPA: DUF4350 domain-containing protein [Sphingomicrobium sp.]|nr:DUF4350 domain-containing protein [Sphingomicrobium sp.]